jgi:hypothetical protein
MDPTTPTPTPVPQPPQPPRRRGCLGCLFHGGLGCFAFLFGAVVAALLFAPMLLGGPAARLLEGVLNERIAGSVAVERLDLYWTRRQLVVLELHDPEGVEVGEFEVSLPGLMTMLGLEEEQWSVLVQAGRVEVTFDGEGGSSWSRAVASPETGGGGGLQFGRFDSRDGYRTSFPYQSMVHVDQLVMEGIDEVPVTLERCVLHTSYDPDGGHATLTFQAAVVRGVQPAGRLGMTSAFAAPRSRQAGSGSAWRGAEAVNVEASVEGLDTGLLDRLGWLPWGELFGPTLDGALSIVDQDEGRVVLADLNGGRVLVDALWEGRLLIGRGGEVAANLQIPLAWMEAALWPHLPVRTGIAPTREPWNLSVSGLQLPVGEFGAPWPARDAVLAGLRGEFSLRTDEDLRLVSDGPVETVLELAAPRFTLALTDQAPQLGVQSANQERSLDALIGGHGDLARTLDDRRYDLDLTTAGLGVRLLDHLRGGDGLLPAFFHPATTALRVERSGGVQRLVLEDSGGSLLAGQLVDGHLVGGENDRAELQLDLERPEVAAFVGKLLPWFEDLRPGPGTSEAKLILTDYRLPIRGDLSLSTATLRLRLGEVRYELAPGLHTALTDGSEERGEVALHLPDFRMRLDRQRVTFQELVIAPSAEEEIDFVGELDLVTESINLDCELPVHIAFDSEPLPGAEGALVAVRLTDTWRDPKKRPDTEAMNQFITLIQALGGGD